MEVRQAQMAAAEAAPEITPLQAADLIREVLAILQPQETVNRALRRLRPQQPPANRKGRVSEPLTLSSWRPLHHGHCKRVAFTIEIARNKRRESHMMPFMICLHLAEGLNGGQQVANKSAGTSS